MNTDKLTNDDKFNDALDRFRTIYNSASTGVGKDKAGKFTIEVRVWGDLISQFPDVFMGYNVNVRRSAKIPRAY